MSPAALHARVEDGAERIPLTSIGVASRCGAVRCGDGTLVRDEDNSIC